MAQSQEYRTVLNSSSPLEVAFKCCDRDIVHMLEKEGFITQEVHDAVLSPKSMLNDDQKAGELVKHIKNKVKLSAEKYHTLVTHLRDGCKTYESIVKILDEEFKKQQEIGDSKSPPLEDIKEDVKSYLRKNLREIIKKYAAFVDTLRQAVENKEVTADDLSSYLLGESVYDKELNITLLADKKQELEKCNTVKAIFDFLKTDYASFLNYGIFESILKYYCIGEDEENENLQYAKHLNDYLQQHNISEFMAAVNHPDLKLKVTKGFKEVNLKLDVKKTCKLSKIQEIRQIVAEILDINPSALHIVDIKDGCIIVTFCIPKYLADELSTSKTAFTPQQKETLGDASIVWLECNGNKFVFKENKKSLLPSSAQISQPPQTSQPPPQTSQFPSLVEDPLSQIAEYLKPLSDYDMRLLPEFLETGGQAWLRRESASLEQLCGVLEASGRGDIASTIRKDFSQSSLNKNLSTSSQTTAPTLIRAHYYRILMKQLEPCQPHWEKIASNLCFSSQEIETIRRIEPETCLGEVLSKWAEGDVKGSKDVATLEVLKTAVNKAGFPKVADSLTLDD